MRKIIVGAQVSLDGVMQAPGGPDEDPASGFKFGGWAWSHWSAQVHEEIDRLMSTKFDLLLGRKTYEIFAGFWPGYDESGPAGDVAKRFNSIKKYPVSRSGDVNIGWAGTTLLRNVDEVKRLRQEDGPNLVTQGSTELVHALCANDLVDEVNTFTFPVVLGGGKKLWADGSAPHTYKLISSRVTDTGVVVCHYERDGEVKTTLGPPTA